MSSDAAPLGQRKAGVQPRWGGETHPFPKMGEIGTVVYLGDEQHLRQPFLLFIPPAQNAVPILKMGASPPLMTWVAKQLCSPLQETDRDKWGLAH